jgi:hypothetical protein
MVFGYRLPSRESVRSYTVLVHNAAIVTLVCMSLCLQARQRWERLRGWRLWPKCCAQRSLDQRCVCLCVRVYEVVCMYIAQPGSDQRVCMCVRQVLLLMNSQIVLKRRVVCDGERHPMCLRQDVFTYSFVCLK